MTNTIINEIHDAWKRRDLCFHLAVGDIKSRHSKSVLGPLWIPFSTALFVGIMGSLYATLFGRDPSVYFPHMTAGFIIWQILDAGIRDGKQKLISSRSIVLQVPIGILTLSIELTIKIIVIFLYNVPVFIVVLLIYPVPIGLHTMQFLLGLALVIFTLVPVIVTASVVGLRFRDLNQLLDSIMRVSFFLTPVIWMPDMVGNRAVYLNANPFYYYLEIVRAPLMGTEIPIHVWPVALAMTVTVTIVAACVLSRSKHEFALWL